MKTLAILGSTGSIGRQALEVVGENPDKLTVYALTAAGNVRRMEEQVRAFRPALAVMMEEEAARELRERVRDLPVAVDQGMPGLLRAVQAGPADTVLNALSGRIGLEPTLAALQAGKAVALANKETLVVAGDLVMAAAKRAGCPVVPVDSEHSAIFQCLEEERESVAKLILTASGGPFWNVPEEELAGITPERALQHPNWKMGAKITVDSATLMNKGLEVIEAHHLFAMPYEKIEVLIHPQSIVHSLVEYRDGSVLAQLGRADMRLPIQYAFSYPGRWPNSFRRLNLRGQTLSFFEPDRERFPALELAYRVGKRGGTLPAVLNAANEVAVESFLNRVIPYARITEIAGEVCAKHEVSEEGDLATILEADLWARSLAQDLCRRG
ncbi:1-deoxy-D-xylulose-5-phosphate reductoisomerase/glyoxylate reductase [Acididesulfobacillus acetoxydans]|uniref:1-deoxy-D-xylulose 5-phosphate reductoisomerase n=1 Tax=Acididesulfobacillus acetoxydans TaxID=1561005 RepID=A0A8S0XZQ8_9FIRM|nr:1-deoxy-D-xylulose-5-phosphate reductoisomerase [Acididesulfobacillus acetoxydans]CAA7602547.1 1-deoxy-D-xylulose-5-phosphate reductoisomerase/glyoxylate reductase [Acididesulfobacillus acetoxydans]CEJ07307.1 1-deoxy-D-xylulose 5-phosphate reductoisomerase [Acididesulfobacillus acetoxydans]